MLLTYTLLLMILLSGVIISIYSLFIHFFNNIADVTNFNIAYYGAISGIERGLLVTKYKEPGFVGSGGFFGGTTHFGPDSDIIPSGFGRFTLADNGFSWSLNGRTDRIPGSGKGNVEHLLASDDSINYNTIDYNKLESFLLYYDNTHDHTKYYTGTDKENDIVTYQGNNIRGVLRLPPKIFSGFSLSLGVDTAYLCDDPNNPLCDSDHDRLYDDIAVNWSIEGRKGDDAFVIGATKSIDYNKNPAKVITDMDNAIRKSTINDMEKIQFDTISPFSPLTEKGQNIKQHTIVSSLEYLAYSGFIDIFSHSDATKIKIGISSLLLSNNAHIYPFLEYYFDFGSPVSDRFFTIQGKSIIGQYDVEIIVKKATSYDTSWGDFTVIF